MANQPLFSKKISSGTRVYYIDYLKDKKGQKFIKISEIITDKAPEQKKRQCIFIHESSISKFLSAYMDVAAYIKNDAER